MKFPKFILIALFFIGAVGQLHADIEAIGSGTVAETIDVDQYVYVKLMENGNWLAASPTEIHVGDKINYSGGALMKNFHSRSLQRTFDEILFVMSLYVTEKAPQDEGAKALIEHAHKGVSDASPEGPAPGEIATVDGSLTIAEIYSQDEELEDKSVILRARVMKVSENILGKNWITLQDGTGTAPDDRLIARSDQTAEIGDEITAKGRITLDVDLGTGYHYKVLLEDAVLTN